MESSATSTLGLLLGEIFCLCDETKMGAFPPGITGRLGIDMASVTSSFSADSFLALRAILLFLSLSRCSCCLSLSLALKGLGLFSLIGDMTTEGESVLGRDDVRDCEGSELTDDGEIDELRMDEPELNRLAPLKRLELARNLELLPNEGVG